MSSVQPLRTAFSWGKFQKVWRTTFEVDAPLSFRHGMTQALMAGKKRVQLLYDPAFQPEALIMAYRAPADPSNGPNQAMDQTIPNTVPSGPLSPPPCPLPPARARILSDISEYAHTPPSPPVSSLQFVQPFSRCIQIIPTRQPLFRPTRSLPSPLESSTAGSLNSPS